MTSSPDVLSSPVPQAAKWQPIPAENGDALARARRETLNIVQWLARIANSYVKAPPEERTVLAFLPREAALVTKTFEGDKALQLQLPTLEMQFLENGRPVPHIFNPEEHSPAKAEAWFLVELLHRGIDREKFSKVLPYEVPNLLSGDAEDYSPESCKTGLEQLTVWFQNAAAAFVTAGNREAIACSPQTLDLTVEKGGFSLGGDDGAEPYFYKTAQAKQSVLKASRFAGERDPLAMIVVFLNAPAN
jgi:hypothetical protein